MREMILSALMAIVAAGGAFADGAVSVDRFGRRVEPDGFLLEWDRQNARPWGDSSWTWDAVNTADGVAGYFLSASAQQCAVWTFAVTANDSSRSITVPEQIKNDFFAFDRGSFDSEGIHTAEWVIPWRFFGDANTPAMTFAAISGCGDTLPSITITAARPNPPNSPSAIYGIMVLIAIITIITSTIKRNFRKRR